LLSAAGLGYLIFSSQYQKIRNAGEVFSINQALEHEIRIRQGREKELRQERDRHTQYLQVAEVVMIELDQAGRIQLINARGLSLLQRVESSVVGQLLASFVPEHYRDQVDLQVNRVVENGMFDDDYSEFPIMAADGSEHVVLWRAGALSETGRDSATFLASGMDVTELRTLEKAIREKEKMTVMGTLAGGIAHDFNNILTAVYGYGMLTLNEVGDNEVAVKNLNRIVSASERAKSLIARLLTFARSEEKEFVPSDIGVIVHEAGELLAGSLPSTIELNIEVPEELSPVMADTTQIHQILMNLCTNASKAMKDGQGAINVKAENRDLAITDLPPAAELLPGRYVVLSVIDDGVGMDVETLDKVFDPFFTTNETGFGGTEKGTGLGLSVVYSIVSSHNGYVNVTSKKNEGSEFTIYLPCCEEEAERQLEDIATESETTNARIYLVDDEELVGDVGKQILTSLGYEVTLFDDPISALSALTRNIDDIDLVITDETMPVMTGTQLATHIREFDQKTPIIIASGNLQALGDTENAYFLRKPYTIPDIRAIVDKALRGSPEPDKTKTPPNNVINIPIGGR
jgi:PAS domain S-box-containing protein